MTFIWFLVRLVLADLVAVIILSAGSMLTALPLVLVSRLENRVHRLLYGFLIVVFYLPAILFMILFWAFWAAYCVGLAYRFINSPEVTNDWVYWAASFISCVTLLSWLAYKEKQATYSQYHEQMVSTPMESGEEFELAYNAVQSARSTDRSTLWWSLYVIVMYGVFVYCPSLMVMLYGPILEFLGVL